MNTVTGNWPEFCIDRLTLLCRLRRYCDGYADETAKRGLQRAIFSVYLDCRRAGVSERAREVLAIGFPDAREVPGQAEACAP